MDLTLFCRKVARLMKSEDELIPTRGALIRLKDWDGNESWKRFFDTYWKLIYGTAIKLGISDAEAQEVVQETLIAVAKKMNEFKYDPALARSKAGCCNWCGGGSRTICANSSGKGADRAFRARRRRGLTRLAGCPILRR